VHLLPLYTHLLCDATAVVDWVMSASGEFGPDARYLSAAAQRVLRTYKVNPSRIALVGFSDGATYALSLGLPLGRVFHHIVAFSPGDMAPPSVVSGLLC
jgi:phospholipase/carboxylesterase